MRVLRRIVLAMTMALGLTTVGVAALAPSTEAASPQLVNAITGTRLYALQRTWAAMAVDYNNDGLEDIWLGYHQQVDSRLMRNNGDGTFTWVAKNLTARVNAQGGILDRHDCAWNDVDHNGLLDVYCSGGRNLDNYYKTAVKDNELWLQLTPGSFTDVATEWGLGDPCGRGRFVAFLDLDNDGWDDLFVGNEMPRVVEDPLCDPLADTSQHEFSKVFLNNGGTGFTFAPQFATPHPSAGVNCAIPMDFNKDGWMDLLACNYKNSRPLLYRNNAGQSFTEVGSWAANKLTAMTDGRYEDITGDGIPDLVASDATGIFYRPGTPTGFDAAVRIYTNDFKVAPNAYGWGVAVGDINGDGQQDVYGLVHDLTLATNPYDVVMVGNGFRSANRPRFTKHVVPGASGNASTVTTLHLQPGGPASFFVQNGREDADGPNQLISWKFA